MAVLGRSSLWQLWCHEWGGHVKPRPPCARVLLVEVISTSTAPLPPERATAAPRAACGHCDHYHITPRSCRTRPHFSVLGASFCHYRIYRCPRSAGGHFDHQHALQVLPETIYTRVSFSHDSTMTLRHRENSEPHRLCLGGADLWTMRPFLELSSLL